MKLVMIGFLALSAQLSFAVIMKPMELDVTCPYENGRKKVRIVSKSSGATVIFGQKVFPLGQLIAGTEGGDPYAQAVSNEGGFNITLSGGDLTNAYDNSLTLEQAKINANINLFRENRSYSSICVGKISFE